MRDHALLVLFALVAPCVAVPAATADVWNKTWPVGGAAQVRVIADDGNIRVDAGEASRVKAVVRTIGWRISDDELRVVERQSGDRVEIEVKVPARNFGFRFRREISIELTVPQGTELDLHTGDGNLTTRGIEGSLRADTGDGNITAVGAKGTIYLHTGDGNIHAEELDGSLNADTGDGNLVLAGRFDAVDARTGDGNIEFTGYAGTRVASGWSLRTGDGNIEVRLPDGIAADLDASTGDGHVTCDFSVSISGRIKETSLRGPMNGGGPTLSIRTGDGNIKIRSGTDLDK